MNRILVKDGKVIPLPDEPMTEKDRLISDIAGMLIQNQRLDFLRFVHRFVSRLIQLQYEHDSDSIFAKGECIEPAKIPDDENS